MKKSLLFVLALPLLLASCTTTSSSSNPFSTTPQTSDADDENPSQQGGTQTGGNTDHGTEGSGTGTMTGGDTETGGGQTTGGGGTETGGGTTTGGGTETGGGTTTGGGSGSETQTSKTVSKAMADLGVASQKDVTSFDLASDLHVACAQGSNKQNKPKYYSTDLALRLYGGNTITFESTSNITKIQFVKSSETNNEELEASTGSFKNDCWTGNAKSVTLTVFGSSGKYCIVSISATYNGSGTTTGGGGGTETGGGGTETGGGGSQTGGTDDGANYISTWPENFQPFVTTYLNGMLPCFLNTNKQNLFTGYMTGTYTMYDENDNPYLVPYFNPYIKNTSPGINYEYDYGTILRNAGFKQTDEFYDDELEATVYYYQKGKCCVQYNKHRSDEDRLYYFDVYAYYDNYYTGSFKNSYDIQYDNKELGLTNRYESNNKTVKVGNWNITMNDVMKSSYSIQLKADSGSIAIQGSLKGLIIEPVIGTNAEALFVKAGTNASNVKYVFNNGGYFDFPSGTTYAEISAKYRVLNIEYFDIIY